MKTILLTGASGFVGTNFILDLHTKFRIIALVRQNSDVKIIENKCEILRYGDDIYQTLDEICGKIDGVIHLATKWLSSHTPEDIKDIIDTNILLGTYILEAVKRHRVAFFINATSFGAYCNSNRYRPATLYAASKRAFEDIIKYYALVAKNTTFCNLLIFNTFGLYDKTPRLFNLLDRVALNGDELDMSDGIQIVDYTHIKNVVFGFECLINLVLEKPSFCKNKLFTLQSPNRRSLRELVALYERLLGKKLHINWGRRAKRELEITQPFSGGVRLPNWREKVSLEAGLSELIARNVKNRKVGEMSAESHGENSKVGEVCNAKNSAIKNHTAKAKNAKNHTVKNRKWGGAESRFLKESFALYIGDSTLTVIARLCKKPKQSIKSHTKQKDSAESSDKKDLLYGLPRLDKVKSRNDKKEAYCHSIFSKCFAMTTIQQIITKSCQSLAMTHSVAFGLPPMTSERRFHAKIAKSCNDKLNSDSTTIFTRKLHKSPTLKAVA